MKKFKEQIWEDIDRHSVKKIEEFLDIVDENLKEIQSQEECFVVSRYEIASVDDEMEDVFDDRRVVHIYIETDTDINMRYSQFTIPETIAQFALIDNSNIIGGSYRQIVRPLIVYFNRDRLKIFLKKTIFELELNGRIHTEETRRYPLARKVNKQRWLGGR